MTNRELAKKLGISPATLSLVINHKPGISDTTRAKVIEQLEMLGYHDILKKPNTMTVESEKKGNICFVAYKRHGNILDYHPFFLLIMEGVESCAHKYGYNLLFLTIDRRQSVPEQLQRLQKMNCAGAILFATEMQMDDIAIFKQLQLPYIVLDNDFPFFEVDCVAINNALGTYEAIEYLHRMGHTQIGYLKSSTFINSFGERENGFKHALSMFNLQLNPEFVYELNYSEEVSYQEFKQILASSPTLPSAFVSDDDTIAAGVIRALTESGFSVPNDVSIVGFNDRPLCELSSPPITTVRVPKYAFGAMAIDLLVKRMRDDDINLDAIGSIKYRIGTELVVRKSVAQNRKISP